MSEMYQSDLPSLWTLDIRYDRWSRKWKSETHFNNDQANSTLKLVKGYLRTTMTTKRLSGLVLRNIHYKKPVDYDAVVQLFAERYPRIMLLVDPVFDETQN
ncbi:unnamed protein product [Porites evermanni]|uniref:Uncharacterized protein n=1 Tax=Porites evermanni TaxID=104178 RepID=A0ABN8PVV5_9CNID|nr:unnamed protein product [Porites evermanni]